MDIRINEFGNNYWYNDLNQLHREDGPAYVSDISQQWFINGKRYRLCGPAVIFTSGIEHWYYKDKQVSKEHHPFYIFKNDYKLSNKYEEWPTDMKMLFKLTYEGET